MRSESNASTSWDLHARSSQSPRPPRSLESRGLRVAALALGLIASFGCNGGKEPRRRNLLLISVDTLRADRLSGYGYGRPTSPRIDEFMKSAVRFDDAQAHASWTIPSLATTMTSLYPSTHGAVGFNSRLDESRTTLAEMLKARGYRTSAVVAQVFLQPKYGITQGFDDVRLKLEQDAHGRTRPLGEQSTSAEIAQGAVEFFESAKSSSTPWFLWVHFFDPHEKYIEHKGISGTFGTSTPSDLYDGEIRFTDHYVGAVLDALQFYRFAEDTIVVFISDHGEEFGEHGGHGHGQSLHEELMRIPLAIRVPGENGGGVVKDLVRSIDVLPTCLELLGAPARDDIEGRSLVPRMRGEPFDPAPCYSEVRQEANFDAIASGNYKLIVDRFDPDKPLLRLFDRSKDPHETTDIAAKNPDLVERMSRALEAVKASAARRAAAIGNGGSKVDLNSQELDAMRELGYLK